MSLSDSFFGKTHFLSAVRFSHIGFREGIYHFLASSGNLKAFRSRHDWHVLGGHFLKKTVRPV